MIHRRPAIHFAVTSHGLGHLTRTLVVMRAFHALAPATPIYVSTTADPAWIAAQLGFEVHCRSQSYEPGAVQKNCFEVDIAATRRAYRRFLEEREARLAQEMAFLEEAGIRGVVSDIAALAVRAAAQCDIPALGISNFTWDWIIEPYCAVDGTEIPALLAEDYAKGSLLLRLPFGPNHSAFPRTEQAPLIGRRARYRRETLRALLGVGEGPLALVCPGGWSADDWPPIQARPGAFGLISVGDLPVTSGGPLLALPHQLPSGISFPDLVNAVDVVLGKPGYGLASECCLHRTPFVMTERPDFRETPILISQFREIGRGALLSLDAFFAGEWASALETAVSDTTEWAPHDEQAGQQIAERLIDVFGLTKIRDQ